MENYLCVACRERGYPLVLIPDESGEPTLYHRECIDRLRIKHE